MDNKRIKYTSTLATYRRYAIKCAKELLYDPEIIEQLQNAKTESEIQSIMVNAREGCK